jgi:hypothetical protein
MCQVDEHNFEDKELYYRFYIDEDFRYKRYWEEAQPPSRANRRWRFQPHMVFNSPFLTPRIADGLQEGVSAGNAAMFRSFLDELRTRVRTVVTSDASWRVSK